MTSSPVDPVAPAGPVVGLGGLSSARSVAEIRALCEAATPGPWFVVEQPWNDGLPFIVAGSPDPHCGRFVCDLEDMSAGAFEVDAVVEGGLPAPNEDADAAFIAAARESVPSLLAEVGRLRAQVEADRAALVSMNESLDVMGESKTLAGRAYRDEFGAAAARLGLAINASVPSVPAPTEAPDVAERMASKAAEVGARTQYGYGEALDALMRAAGYVPASPPTEEQR